MYVVISDRLKQELKITVLNVSKNPTQFTFDHWSQAEFHNNPIKFPSFRNPVWYIAVSELLFVPKNCLEDGVGFFKHFCVAKILCRTYNIRVSRVLNSTGQGWSWSPFNGLTQNLSSQEALVGADLNFRDVTTVRNVSKPLTVVL